MEGNNRCNRLIHGVQAPLYPHEEGLLQLMA